MSGFEGGKRVEDDERAGLVREKRQIEAGRAWRELKGGIWTRAGKRREGPENGLERLTGGGNGGPVVNGVVNSLVDGGAGGAPERWLQRVGRVKARKAGWRSEGHGNGQRRGRWVNP